MRPDDVLKMPALEARSKYMLLLREIEDELLKRGYTIEEINALKIKAQKKNQNTIEYLHKIQEERIKK